MSRLSAAFDLTPASGVVVGDNGLEEGQERPLVEGFTLAHLNRACGQVALPLIDDALGIRCDGVVDKDVDMVPGGEQRANVAIQREVWPVGALDSLGEVRVGGMHQIPHAAANVLLPVGERIDIVVDTGIGVVGAHWLMVPSAPTPDSSARD